MARLFSGSSRSTRKQKALECMVHRLEDGVPLGKVMWDEYVRRQAPPEEAKQILERPEVAGAAREGCVRTPLPGSRLADRGLRVQTLMIGTNPSQSWGA